LPLKGKKVGLDPRSPRHEATERRKRAVFFFYWVAPRRRMNFDESRAQIGGGRAPVVVRQNTFYVLRDK
jgi:hypothetical protein